MSCLPLFCFSLYVRKTRRREEFFCRLQITLDITCDLRNEEPFDLTQSLSSEQTILNLFLLVRRSRSVLPARCCSTAFYLSSISPTPVTLFDPSTRISQCDPLDARLKENLCLKFNPVGYNTCTTLFCICD